MPTVAFAATLGARSEDADRGKSASAREQLSSRRVQKRRNDNLPMAVGDTDGTPRARRLASRQRRHRQPAGSSGGTSSGSEEGSADPDPPAPGGAPEQNRSRPPTSSGTDAPFVRGRLSRPARRGRRRPNPGHDGTGVCRCGALRPAPRNSAFGLGCLA